MLSHKELIQTPEYWLETIQNEIFRQVSAYMEKGNLNQTQLAEKLNFSRGYISQIMNGNFNFTLKKLIELSISIGIIPDLQFKSTESYINEKEQIKVISLDYTEIIEQKAKKTFISRNNSFEFNIDSNNLQPLSTLSIGA